MPARRLPGPQVDSEHLRPYEAANEEAHRIHAGVSRRRYRRPPAWAMEYRDKEVQADALERLSGSDALLMGRGTYELFAAIWPGQEDSFADRISEPPEPAARELLDQYIDAFENADAAALERLLRRDAVLELPPSTIWYADGNAIATAVAGLGSPGDWRMVPTAANGQPAAAAYLRGADDTYRAYAIVVLTASTAGIARITVFGDPGDACGRGSEHDDRVRPVGAVGSAQVGGRGWLPVGGGRDHPPVTR